MTIDYGRMPKGGFAKLVAELLVEDLSESLYFWREALGFEIAYQRPEQKFVYLERPEGAQIMLCERSGRWETGPMEKPYGRGVMFQIYLSSIDPIIGRLKDLRVPIYAGPREVWRRYGDREGGKREVIVLDPNGYLIMLAEDLGERPSNTRELLTDRDRSGVLDESETKCSSWAIVGLSSFAGDPT